MYVTAAYFCNADTTLLRHEPTGLSLGHFTGTHLTLTLDHLRRLGIESIRLGNSKTDEFKKIVLSADFLYVVDPDPDEV